MSKFRIYHLVICVIVLLTASDGLVRRKRIVGGSLPEKDQLPFAVSLQLKFKVSGKVNYRHFCGGVFVENFVITAGHCVLNKSPQDVYIQIGGEEINSNQKLFFQASHIESQHLNRYTLKNDIAVILFNISKSVLEDPFRSSLKIKDFQFTATPEHCFIYGFGATGFQTTGNKLLHFAPINVLNFDHCVEKMGPVIAPEPNCGMFCAQGTGHVDACLGDSGSAMICKNQATHTYFPMGIISYGMGCGVEGMPGVYTNVSYHIKWIELVAYNQIK